MWNIQLPFDRLRERNIQDAFLLTGSKRWNGHGMGDAQFTVVPFPRCQLQPVLATLRKVMETMGCLAKKSVISKLLLLSSYSWFSRLSKLKQVEFVMVFLSTELFQRISGGGDVWEGTPSPALGCTVCGSQHDAFMDGVWQFWSKLGKTRDTTMFWFFHFFHVSPRSWLQR